MSRGLFAVASALCVVAAACTGTGSPTSAPEPPRPLEGGTLRVGTTGSIDSLNPLVAQSSNAILAFRYVYPYLVALDKDLQFAPEFAANWSRSTNGLDWTFHTTPRAVWSDGKPLTAEDAAWTLQTFIAFQRGPTALVAGQISHMTSAVAPDLNTLVIRYDRPVANALSQLLLLPILPRHVWERYARGNGAGLTTFPNLPPMVSGGPFTMSRYRQGQVALFARNRRWWGLEPHLDGFGLEFFGNPDAMVQAFKNDEIDAIETPVPPTAVSAVRSAGGVITRTPGLGLDDLIINSSPHKQTHRELLDGRVREAFEYATDRLAIARTAYVGYAETGGPVIPPAAGSWSNSSIEGLPFDLSAANRLLDAAGYSRGAGGTRVAMGHPMSYQVVMDAGLRTTGLPTFRILQRDFAEIGVRVSLRTYQGAATFQAITCPRNRYEGFDLAIWDWFPPNDPDFMLAVFTCAQYGNFNDSGYCNPSYDAMYLQQSAAADQGDRRAIVYRMQETLAKDRPYIVLDYPDVLDAYHRDWTGFSDIPGAGIFGTFGKQSLLDVHRIGG